MKKKFLHARRDFTEQDLPATRAALFRDCYRVHFPLLLRLGLTVLLFMLPLLLIELVADGYEIGLNERISSLTEQEWQVAKTEAALIFGAARVVLRALFAFLLAGAVQVLRQLIWNEPIFFRDDLRAGLRENGARFFAAGAFMGIGLYTLSLLPSHFLTGVFGGALLFFCLPTVIWWLLWSVYYRLTFFGALKNAFAAYLRTAPRTLLLTLVTVAPLWSVETLLHPYPIARYVLWLLWAVLAAVPTVMAWLLTASDTFDEEINRTHYPTAYRRGLRPLPPRETQGGGSDPAEPRIQNDENE